MSEQREEHKKSGFSMDHLTRPADFDMGRSHSHPYYEIYYVEAGQCRMFMDHKIYYMEPGDVALVMPSRLHRAVYGTAKAVRRYTVCFTARYVSWFAQNSPDGTLEHIFSRQKLSVPPSWRPELEIMLSAMEREKRNQDSCSEVYTKSVLFQLLIFLKRCGDGIQFPVPQTLDPIDMAIQAAADYIHQCHRNPVTLESAARTAHMSASYFSKKFKQSTGFGFRYWLGEMPFIFRNTSP